MSLKWTNCKHEKRKISQISIYFDSIIIFISLILIDMLNWSKVKILNIFPIRICFVVKYKCIWNDCFIIFEFFTKYCYSSFSTTISPTFSLNDTIIYKYFTSDFNTSSWTTIVSIACYLPIIYYFVAINSIIPPPL